MKVLKLLACLLVAYAIIGATACDSVTSTEPTATPTPTRGIGGLNITREQYEEAFAKWSAQGIEEYELRVEYWAFSPFMGIWTLRISRSGGDVKLLDYKREPGLDAPDGGIGSQLLMPTDEQGIQYLKEQLKVLTIESQFQYIEEALTGRWDDLKPTVTVKLDPILGNPTYVDSSAELASEPSS